MGNFKPAIIFTALGFVLSFIVGLISGVNFLSVILRALITAAVFAGFFFLVQVLFKKQLPELFTDSAESRIGENDGTGKNLNIVLDEDDEMSAADIPLQENSISKSSPDTAGEEGLGSVPAAETSDLPDAPQSTASAQSVSNAAVSVFPESETPVVPPVEGNAVQHEQTVLDELPNLDAFETSFSDDSSETTADLVDAGADHLQRIENADFNSENLSNMAQAIKTVLKKDAT